MTEKSKEEIPEFKSLQEEKEYWDRQGPLAPGHKGRWSKPEAGEKRSSFLSVRMTGKEIDRLHEIAKEHGMGVSTFARKVLTSVIENHSKPPGRLTLDEFAESLVKNLPESQQEQLETLTKDVLIGSPDNPSLMVVDAKQLEEFKTLYIALMKVAWKAICRVAGVQLITPEDKEYERVKEIIQAKA